MIKIITNPVGVPWEPSDLETGIGGSEECAILLAEALQRNTRHNVAVYLTKRDEYSERNGVQYMRHSEAAVFADDIVIGFKTPHLWQSLPPCKKRIHWSSDVEQPWDTSQVDHIVSLTDFHRRRNWFCKSTVIPHGIDKEIFKATDKPHKENEILYCSSPDRGLMELLNDWHAIGSKGFKLKITYGMDYFPENVRAQFRAKMDQEGVEYLGKVSQRRMVELMQECRYWVNPLNRADSELFCLAAVKARSCGMVPIVNPIGALAETAGDHIEYAGFASHGNREIRKAKTTVPILSWDEVVKKYWTKLIEGEK